MSKFFIFISAFFINTIAFAQVQPISITKTAMQWGSPITSLFIPFASNVQYSYDITLSNPNANGTMLFSVSDAVPADATVLSTFDPAANVNNIIGQTGNNVTWTGTLQPTETRTITINCEIWHNGSVGTLAITNTANVTCGFSCNCVTPPPPNCNAGATCLTCADILSDNDPTNDSWCTGGTCQYFFSSSSSASVSATFDIMMMLCDPSFFPALDACETIVQLNANSFNCFNDTWDINGTAFIPNNGTLDVSSLAAGNYTITHYGDWATSVALTIAPRLSVSLSANTPANIVTIIATAINGNSSSYSYQWSAGVTPLAGGAASTSTSGDYTVTVTDANGCSSTSTVAVVSTHICNTAATISGNTSFCTGSNATLTAAGSAGSGVYTYSWNTGATTAITQVTASGNYTVTATDTNGCTASTTIAIIENILPAPVIVLTNSGNNVTTPVSPTAPALGFNVFVKNSMTVTSSETEGAIAVGGDFNINGDHNITVFPYYTYQVGGVNISLLVGGKVNYNGGNRLSIQNNGYVKIGNSNGSTAWYTDPNNAPSPIRITPNSNYNSSPRIELSANAPTLGVSAAVNPIFQANIIDFAAAFTTLSQYATNMQGLADNASLTDANGVPIGHTNLPSQVKITLNAGNNVLNLTGADMNTVTNFIFNNQPDATHTLLVNVNAAGTFNWNTWNNGSIGGVANCKYVLYNFYNTTALAIAGFNVVEGTVFAPSATITKTTNNAHIEGQIIGQSYSQTAGGEIHYALFTPTVANQTTTTQPCSTAMLTATGGNTYSWNTGETTATITPSLSGTYTVTVITAAGCTASTTMTVAVTTCNLIPTLIGHTNVLTCTQTTAILTATGGVLYNFGTGFQANSTFSVSNSGIYTVTVQCATGCTATATTAITQDITTPSISLSTNNQQICTGVCATLTASSTASGAVFVWATSATTSSITVCPTIATSYTVTATNPANSCTTSTSISINVTANLTASPISATVNCNNRTIAVNYTGTATPTWTINGLASLPTNIGTPAIFTMPQGSCDSVYKVMAMRINAVGCMSKDSTTVIANCCQSQFTMGFCNQNIVVTNLTNYTNVAQFTWSLIPLGNPTIQTYTGTGAVGQPLCTANTGFMTGNYTLCLTPQNCQAACGNICKPVTILPQLTAVRFGNKHVCSNTPFSWTFNAFGGTLPYRATVVTCAGTAIVSNLTMPNGSYTMTATAPPVLATTSCTYCITVTDATGCTTTLCDTLFVHPAPINTMQTVYTICENASATIGTTATAGTTYAWKVCGSASNLATTAAFLVSPTTTTIYCVRLTNSYGCINSQSVTVGVNSAPVIHISGDSAICRGACTMLTANSLGANTSYLWSTGSGSGTSPSQQVCPVVNTIYSVVATDGLGCKATTYKAVTVAIPPIASLTANSPLCHDGLGSLIINTTGAGNTYTVSPVAGVFTNNTLTDLPIGFYTITINYATGCTNVLTTQIVDVTAIELSVSGALEFCQGSNTILNAAAVGGNGSYSYAWSDGATTTSLLVQTGGTHTVTVTDGNGCTASTEVAIIENANPDVSIAGATSSCTDMNQLDVTVTNCNAVSYSWPTANNQTTATILNAAIGTHTVWVTCSNGCVASATHTISPAPTPLATITATNLGCNAAGCQFSFASANNSTAAIDTYTWDFGDRHTATSATAVHNFAQAGSYTVCVTLHFANGCTAQACTVVTSTISVGCDYSYPSLSEPCSTSSICIPLIARNAVPLGMIGIDYCMTYDATKIRPRRTGGANTGIVNAGIVATANDPNVDYATYIDDAAGKMRVSLFFNANAAATATFSGIGDVACVEFDILPSAIGTTISLTDCELIESFNGGVLFKCADPGTLAVTTDPLLTGKIIYWNEASRPLRYDAANPTAYLMTNIQGTDATCNPTAAMAVQPDLNGDFSYDVTNGTSLHIQRDIANTQVVMSMINGLDAYQTQYITTNNPAWVPNVYQMLAADVNTDGFISAGDISQMGRRTVLSQGEFVQVMNNSTATAPIYRASPTLDWRFVSQSMLASEPQYAISSSYPANNAIGYSKYLVPRVADCMDISISANGACMAVGDETYNGILLGDLVSFNTNTIGDWVANASGVMLREELLNTVIYDLNQAKDSEKGDCSMRIPVYYNSNEAYKSVDFIMDYNEQRIATTGVTAAQDSNYISTPVFNNLNNAQLLATTYSKRAGGFSTNEPIGYIELSPLSGSTITAADLGAITSYFNGGKALSEIRGTAANCGRIAPLTPCTSSLYPNITEHEFTVSHCTTDGTISVYDLLGRLLYSIAISANTNKTIIDITELPAAPYFVRINGEDALKVIKM